MSPKSHRAPLHFYVLPRGVAIRILTFLPLTSLLTCARVNHRFHTLITRGEEIRPHLFLEPPGPSPPPGVSVPVYLHPVFGRLSFFAYHSAKAIRIGEGVDGIFLVGCAVRKQFATTPALEEVAIRVISGGEWPLDAEIAVTNEKGVTVWDVVQGITGFFNEYSQVSFGDHFGIEFCRQHEWDPKALMQNHEFLNPESPFPTIYIPDRGCNRVFIADYAFNEFAAVPLVLRPVERCTEGNEDEKATARAKDPTEVKEGGAVEGEVGEVKEIKLDGGVAGVRDTEETNEIEKVEEIEKIEEIKEAEEIELAVEELEGLEQPEGVEDNDVLGSIGSQSMDIDNGSEPQEEFHLNSSERSSGEPNNYFPTGEAAAIPRSCAPEEEHAQEELDDMSFSFKISASALPASTSSDSVFPNTGPDEPPSSADTPPAIKENQAELNCTIFPEPAGVPPAALGTLNEIPSVGPVTPTIDSKTLGSAPIQVPIEEASEPVDWEDAFD